MKYKKPKINKLELREIRRKKREDAMKGDGEYLFANNTRGDLALPKAPIKGANPNIPPEKQLSVPAGRTFVGDNYFFCMMKTNDIRLIEVIKPASNERNENMSEQKLILDQPERFTNDGQTEQIIPKDKSVKPLNENQPSKKDKSNNTLLTEDPLEGVEILLG